MSRNPRRASLAAFASLLLTASIFAVPTAATAAPLSPVVINEVESDDAVSEDWVELMNTGTEAADVSGWMVRDDDDTRQYVIAEGTVIPAGGYLTAEVATDVDGYEGFGLGKADIARLFLADGTTMVDSFAWDGHAATTYGRCADGTGEFRETNGATKTAVNDCEVRAADAVRINEIESSDGTPGDWIELTNIGRGAADVSGLVVSDADDTHAYVIPEGTSIPVGGFLVLDESTFGFGLGGADSVRIFEGSTVIDSYAWAAHAGTTYGRNPDGIGPFAVTSEATKSAANVFAPAAASPVRINEVESNGGTPGDWIELINTGAEPVDASDWLVKDNDDTRTTRIPAGTIVPAGGYFVIEESLLGFGLGAADSARVYAADGFTVIDEHSWTSHATTTLGRCPDGTGEFILTGGGTKAAPNACDGPIEEPTDPTVTSPWPGGAAVTVVDDADLFSGDLSGLVHEADGTASGALWAVENGNGLLSKLAWDGTVWADAGTRSLAYVDGTGTPDAEGVTVTSTGSSGGVYVATERNDDASGVSRPSILRYDVDGALAAPGATLPATTEWNLASDLPVLGANGGLEGIAWIPDAALTAGGFVDQSTGSSYVPANYPGHGDGLFFVGVEQNGLIYAYALASDGTFDRIASFTSGFAGVMELAYDAASGALWAVCDEACDGRMAVLDIVDGAFAVETVYERPAGMANIANEGFAFSATCVDGVRAAFWADDSDTDGHSLRTGTLDCGVGGEPGPGDGDGSGDGDGGSGGGSGDGSTPPAAGGPRNPAASDDQLTDATRGGVSAPASAAPGQSVTITVGVLYAGQSVDVWLHSTPMFLGIRTVSAAGTVSVVIPANAPAGAHRIVVLAADGSVIGWADIRVGALQVTGAADASGLGLAGLGMLGLGLGLLTLRRRFARASVLAS